MGILVVPIHGYYSHVAVEEPKAEVLSHRLKVNGKARTQLNLPSCKVNAFNVFATKISRRSQIASR